MNRRPHPLITMLNAERRRQGLSQDEVAARAHLGQKTISDCETAAHEPLLDSVTRYANALGFDLIPVPQHASLPQISAATAANRRAAYHRLRDAGEPVEVAAARVGVTRGTAVRYDQEIGRPTAFQQVVAQAKARRAAYARLRAEGLSPLEAAAELGVSPKTAAGYEQETVYAGLRRDGVTAQAAAAQLGLRPRTAKWFEAQVRREAVLDG